MGFRCTRCGAWHEDLPFSYAAEAPTAWSPEAASYAGSELGEETCVIRGEEFFIRGQLVLAVEDAGEDFVWGVWVELGQEDAARREGPGRLANELPVYGLSTLDLPAQVRPAPAGERPLVELEPGDHPLAREQHEGITTARVQAFAEALVH